MRCASTLLRRLAFPVAAILLALAWSTAAVAGEQTALERLTAHERAQLAAQVEGWDQLPPERQERLARSVIRIRELPEDQRRALLERIERLKRSREAGQGPRPDRLKQYLDPGRMKSHRQRGHVMKAVGAVLWSELPEGTRQAIDGTFEGPGREQVMLALFRRMVGRIASERIQEGIPPIELPVGAPKEKVEQITKLRARAEAGDEKALRFLAMMSTSQDLSRAMEGLVRDGPPDEAAARRVGAVVKERFPGAIAAAVAELVKAAEDPETLRRYAPPHRRHGDRRGGAPEEQARRLLDALDPSSALFEGHPELAEPAQKLRRLLRKIAGDRAPRDRTGPGGRPGSGGRGHGFPGGARGPGPRRGPQPPPDHEPPDDDGPPPDDG